MLGAAGFYAGLLINTVVLAIAVASTLAGWGTALYALLRVLLDTDNPDKRHPTIIFIALSLGWCSLAAYLIWLLSDNAFILRFAIQGGLWLFLLPVFASVAHRMLPFFTSSALPQYVVRRPEWPWWTMLAGSVMHALLQLANASNWLWLSDFAHGFCGTVSVLRLGIAPQFAHPPARRLAHRFCLDGYCPCCCSASRASYPLPAEVQPRIWGLAPQHALTIGCFATLLIGLGTRVTLGHSGLPMQVDKPVKLMFLGIQMVAILRVLADMLPGQNGYWLYIAAAALWLVCFFPWVLRYLPVYVRPRVDGQAG